MCELQKELENGRLILRIMVIPLLLRTECGGTKATHAESTFASCKRSTFVPPTETEMPSPARLVAVSMRITHQDSPPVKKSLED
jgi:hypothetical protein